MADIRFGVLLFECAPLGRERVTSDGYCYRTPK
jgi:hypothetical protein